MCTSGRMKPFSWHELFVPQMAPWEVAFRAACVYVAVQVALRLVGRRELQRYSVFDAALLFLITVALRRSITADDSSLTSGFVALATLVGLDSLLAQVTFRSERAARALEGPVKQLVRDGHMLPDAMADVHLSERELFSLLRQRGEEHLGRVKAAYLEPNGQVSFIFRKDAD